MNALVRCAPSLKSLPEPSLDELARLINQAYDASFKFAYDTRAVARQAIEAAVACGGWLRQAKRKVKKEKHERWLRWLKENTVIEPRTGSNYAALHKWVGEHQDAILKSKPRSLRQFYILAGILPEDEPKVPSEKPDELSKLRRLVRRTALEAAAHRGYAETPKLWDALKPLAALLREVSTDLGGEKGKHVSFFDNR
jgi:hypothetical protein